MAIARDAARLGLQALPPLRRRLRLRRDLPRPPRALPLPVAAASERPTPTVAAERIALDGTRGAELHAAHAGRRAPRSSCRSRPLQRLQRARRRRAVPGARRSPLEQVVAGLAAVTRRVRPRRDGRDRRRRAVDPADQEPGRGQRDPAHARARARRARPARRSSTTAPPTAATSRGSGTPTSSCWPPRVRRVTCAGHPRRRAGAAAEVRRRPGASGCASSRSWPARSTRRSARRRSGRLFALPTYTALLELREELAARGHVAPLLGAGRAPAMSVIWHDLECGALRRGPAAVARAGRRARRPGARRRRRHRPRRARPRPRAATG